MKITAINTIKYKGQYIAPGETFDADKKIATDLLKQGVATACAVDTTAAAAEKSAAAQEAAMIEKIKAVKNQGELAELIPDNETRPAILAAGEARWKELGESLGDTGEAGAETAGA
ncbi:MAG: hypothetical protein AB7D06_08890 [Pedobacter sp.]